MLSAALRRIWPSTYFTGGIVALSFALPLPQHDKILGLPSPCLAQYVFHVPCPACGLTRAFVATAHGHIQEALHWHPLGPLLFSLAFAYALWSLWIVQNEKTVQVSPRLQLIGVSSLSLAVLIFWGLRLAGFFPLTLT